MNNVESSHRILHIVIIKLLNPVLIFSKRNECSVPPILHFLDYTTTKITVCVNIRANSKEYRLVQRIKIRSLVVLSLNIRKIIVGGFGSPRG